MFFMPLKRITLSKPTGLSFDGITEGESCIPAMILAFELKYLL